MALFDRLPYEIHVDILSHLSKEDLICTSRVSHDWCTISEPLLYRDQELTGLYPTDPSCYSFIRKIMSPGRERLAGYVRSLTVRYREQFDLTLPDNLPDWQAVPFTQPPLLRADPLAAAGAHVVLLMHLLTRLHTLRLAIDGAPGSFNTFMEAHHEFPLTSALPPALQSLRHIQWDPLCPKLRLNLKMLLTFLSLPCIDTIETVMSNECAMHLSEDNDTSATATDTVALTGTSSVTRLSLSFLGEACRWLTRILLIPRELTYFSCCDFSYRKIDFLALQVALKPLQSSLTHLSIDVFVHDETNNIGSLREWSVLRSVKIPAMILLGPANVSLAHVLPYSLQELEIIDGIGSSEVVIMEAVVAMLQVKDTMTPGFKRLALGMNGTKLADLVKVVVEACAVAGVELVDHCFPSLE